MSLSLRESNAVAGMAKVLYLFLPNSGKAGWTNHVKFRTIAQNVGAGEFWQAGSKLPSLTALLQQTLDRKRSIFEKLIIEIVRAGIVYRDKNGEPVAAAEIDKLNGYLLEVSFKFPDLWDPEFRASLANPLAAEKTGTPQQAAVIAQQRSDELANLKIEFFALDSEPNRQQAGLDFEKLLNKLFAVSGLKPRQSFRINGEQIDGSFELDHDIYLVEAKWEKNKLPERPMLEFRAVIEGKSAYTRGVFIAINGITEEAMDAIVRGKQPTFFRVNGHDLLMVLSEAVTLGTLLRQKRRILAEEGLMSVPFSELWSGSRGDANN